MKLKLNREFLIRHLFALAVFAALGGWFGFDAFVRYPQADAAGLYKAIEKSDPPEGTDLAAFKNQKISTQKAFALLTLLAAAGVGVHLLAVSRFRLEWNEDGFTFGGVKRPWSAITHMDESKWTKKGVFSISGDGWKATLDAWYFLGVKDFFEKVKNRG